MDYQNGWTEWSKFVLKELERLNECYDKMSTDVGGIKTEIALLKLKSGAWGAGASIATTLLILLMGYLTGHIK